MHACILSHGLKRSRHSYPRRLNASNKNTPSMHHARRWNVTMSMVGLKMVTSARYLTINGEPWRCNWGTQRRIRHRQPLTWGASHPPCSAIPAQCTLTLVKSWCLPGVYLVCVLVSTWCLPGLCHVSVSCVRISVCCWTML